MKRYAAGKPVKFPYRVQRQMVAQAYGQTPWAVDDWPADEFEDAVQMLGLAR